MLEMFNWGKVGLLYSNDAYYSKVGSHLSCRASASRWHGGGTDSPTLGLFVKSPKCLLDKFNLFCNTVIDYMLKMMTVVEI